MAPKPLIIASLIGASIGVPYVASQSKNGAPASDAASQLPANGVAATPSMPAATSSNATAVTSIVPQALPPGSSAPVPHSPSAEQALNFNVTKEWVYRSWDRKSTGPTDVGLMAVRVPLVTGTQAASLAGSLTYYFNVQNQVEHISFRGRTGDPSRLIQFVTSTYRLQPASAPIGEKLYQLADGGGVQSELRTRPEPIVASTSPLGSHFVELELARPGSERYLPPRPTGLNVPQTPDAIQAASNTNSASSADAAAATSESGGGYFDKVRYATPEEASQVLWRRWPN